MAMADCPCCLPPWFWSRNNPDWFCYAGGGNFSTHANLIRKVALDGTFIGNIYSGSSTSDGLRSICTDPLTGNIYFSAHDDVYAISNNGTALWNSQDDAFLLTFAVACDALGHVYSGNENTIIRQRDATTGTVNWSYFTPGPSFMQIYSICCDKAGNSYATGPGRNINLYSLDVNGNLRWETSLPDTATSSSDGVGNSVAINDANDTLVVAQRGQAGANRQVEVLIDAATGSVIGTPASIGSQLAGCAWDNDDNYYTIDYRNEQIRKNGSSIGSYTSIKTFMSTSLQPAFDIGTSNIYFNNAAKDASNATLWTATPVGSHDETCLTFCRGLVGAFGKNR